MSFEIKNLADATYGSQAEVDNVDIDILVQGIAGDGVVSGCAVSQRSAGANMSVDVASGTVQIAGASVSVASGNVAVSAAHASLDRFDLVVVDDTGAKSVVAGTAAGTPEFPEVPAVSVALAAVLVPAASTSVVTAQITDKRVTVNSSAVASIDDLSDVDTTTVAPSDGDRLTWDNASSLWVPAAPAALTAALDDLTDVDLTTTAPSDGDALVYDSASGDWIPGAASGASATVDLLHVRDEKASGTDGGTFTSGAWQTRTLNTVKTNTISGASLASNVITLPAGTYEIAATAQAYRVGRHQLRLYNVTAAAEALLGAQVYTGIVDDGGASSLATVNGRITLASGADVRLEHRCQSTYASGYGLASSWGTEVYAEVLIRKIA